MNVDSLFSYKYRRKLDKKIVNYTYDKLKNIPNIAYIIITIHTIFILYTFTVLFTYDKNSRAYYVCFTFLTLMILINYYFDACPITQLERMLLKNRNWYGFPYNLVFALLNLEINKYRVAIMFWIITISTFIYLISYN